MTDGDALLRAICANPRDDLPRLVYADWLEENGRPERAAFIRTDVEMARRDEFDPERLRYAARREADPWYRNAVKEVGEQLPDGLSWSGVPVIRRGFPWSISAHQPNKWRKHAPAITDRYPVEHLSLQGPLGRNLAQLPAGGPWLARLSNLTVWGPPEPPWLTTLTKSPHAAGVECLSFSTPTLNADRWLPAFLYSPLFPRLTGLGLRGLTGEPARSLAAGLARDPSGPRPRKLDLTHAVLRADTLERLLAPNTFHGLASLDLGYARLRQDGYGVLARADVLSGVASLELWATEPTEAGIRALAGSATFTNLRLLNLSRNHVTSGRVMMLAQSPTFANLRVLGLQSNPLGNAGAAAIATSPHLSNLLVLNLSHCQVGDDGIRAILESPLAERLVLLDLTGSPASAEMKQAVKDRMGGRVLV
jgi:uncharacterized protein (TIGR02996 family)